MRNVGSRRTSSRRGATSCATTFALGLLAGLLPLITAQGLTAQDASRPAEFTPATVSARVFPKYPPEAQRAGVQGIVVLDVEVSEAGQITQVRRLYGKTEFADVAVKAVRQWQFRPAMREGRATADTVPVTIPFLLADVPGSRFPDLARALQDSNERVRLRVAQYAGAAKPPLLPAECLALLKLAQRDESAAVRGVATAYAAPLEAGAHYAPLTGDWEWSGKRTPGTVKSLLVHDGTGDDLSGTGKLVVALDGSFVVLTETADVSFIGQIGSEGSVSATPGGIEVVGCRQPSGGFISHLYTCQLKGMLAGDQASGFRLNLEGENRPACPGAPVFKLKYEFRRRPG